MSDRAERSCEANTVLVRDVLDDALVGVDAAVPDALLAVVGTEGCDLVIQKIAARAVEALDEEDLALAIWQSRPILGHRALGGTIEKSVRAALTDVLRRNLRAHLQDRAAQFTAGEAA